MPVVAPVPKCGTVYNVHSLNGATVCPREGAELYQRPDDKEEVIGKRLEVYAQQTQPLIEYYAKLGLLRTIAGEGELDDVFERMEAAALAKPVSAAAVKVDKARPPKPASKSAAAKKKAAVVKQVASKKKGAGKKKAAGKSAKKPTRKAAPKKAMREVRKEARSKAQAENEGRAPKEITRPSQIEVRLATVRGGMFD